jgi:hypothetical protein
MPGPRVVRVELRAPHGAQPKSYKLHGAAEVGEAGDEGAAQGEAEKGKSTS